MSASDLTKVVLGRAAIPEPKLRQAIDRHRRGDGYWPPSYGPPPGQRGCRVPPHLLRDGAGPISFSGGRPRVTFHGLDDIPPIPPRQDIVEGLVEAGELAVLVGAPKAGKSALAVHLAQAVASGAPFLGRATRRGAVAYLALERPRETVRRLRAVGASGLPIIVSRDRPSLGDEADVEAMIEALQAADAALPPHVPLRVVIVDTARKAFRGLRENDSDSVAIGLDALRRVMRAVPSTAVVLIHHLSKDGSSARGSGAILADVDLELTVVSRGGQRTVEVTGANAIEDGQVLPFSLSPVIDAEGGSVISVAPSAPLLRTTGVKTASSRLPPDARTALDVLVELGGALSFSNWREAAFEAFGDRRQGLKRQAWSKVSRLLIDRGEVSRVGETVSVSATSAQRQHASALMGAQASALGVSAPLPIGEGADAADVPELDSAEAGL